jgi:hypothetical protein
MYANKLVAINGIKSITKNKGATQARASSNPTQVNTVWIQLVKIEVVKNTRNISSAGDHINQMTMPQRIDTIKKGRKLNQSIRGCIVPTMAKPRERNTFCTPCIGLLSL